VRSGVRRSSSLRTRACRARSSSAPSPSGSHQRRAPPRAALLPRTPNLRHGPAALELQRECLLLGAPREEADHRLRVRLVRLV
jgi:hypothetical protein